MTWHDHGNESDEVAFWLDGGGPFVRAIGADYFEDYLDDRQSEEHVPGYHQARFPANQGAHRRAGDGAVEIDVRHF